MGVSFFHTVKSFAQFASNWLLKGGTLVDQNTANIRAATCATCHNNKPSSEARVGCSVCNKMGNAAINAVRSSVIKNNKTTSDHRLLTCAVCGCDLKISVWIPNQILLTKQESNAYPSFCWKKKIEQDQDV